LREELGGVVPTEKMVRAAITMVHIHIHDEYLVPDQRKGKEGKKTEQVPRLEQYFKRVMRERRYDFALRQQRK
jgi:hypothetical protein